MDDPKNDPKLVAICIPTYNQSAYLPAAVASACGQTYAAVEVWVYDDHSTDDTPAVMARLCAQYPNVHYHRQSSNQGIAENCTQMLRRPKTEFIVRLDSDDLLAPQFIERLLPLMEKHEAAGYAHTAIQEIDGRGESRRTLRVARTQPYQDAETALRASASGYRTAANVLLFRAKALHAMNVYAGRPTLVEDYDLSVRLADAGYGNVYLDEVLASYRTWVDGGKPRIKRKGVQLRGFLRVYDESLAPAFDRRGWSPRILLRERRALANRNAAYCNSPLFTKAERAELNGLLFQLGDTLLLRTRIQATRLGLGWVLRAQERIVSRAKEAVKAVLSKSRARSRGAIPHA